MYFQPHHQLFTYSLVKGVVGWLGGWDGNFAVTQLSPMAIFLLLVAFFTHLISVRSKLFTFFPPLSGYRLLQRLLEPGPGSWSSPGAV